MESRTIIIKHNEFTLTEEEKQTLKKAYEILDEIYYGYPAEDKLCIEVPSRNSFNKDKLTLEDTDMGLVVSALDYFSNPDAEIKSV